jgi:CRISPR-associated endoribonuclease Cas6
MRVKLELFSKNPVRLNIAYNHQIQSFIYNNLSNKIGSFIHDKGYEFEKRQYKLFTFSKLRNNGKSWVKDKKVFFEKSFHFCVSSIDEEFIKDFSSNIIKNELNIGGNEVYLENINVSDNGTIEKHISNGKVSVKTLSPIFMYSTLENGNRVFHSPDEKEYPELIKNNLLKKFYAFYENYPADKTFDLELKEGYHIKKQNDYYKKNRYECYYASFVLSGSIELIKFAYDVGLGSRNSQGFGCIEVIS